MKFLYIHGRDSAAFGRKVNAFRSFFGAENVITINYPYDPRKAVKLLEFLVICIKDKETLYTIGSSQGGYFALYFAHKYKVPAILINPQTKAESARDAVGMRLRNFKTGEEYIYREEYYSFLKEIEVSPGDIEKIADILYVYLDEGDDVIDGPGTYAYFKDCGVTHLKLYPGGDHFFQHLDDMMEDLKNIPELILK